MSEWSGFIPERGALILSETIHNILCFLETRIRLPLEGSAFDQRIATPLKIKYLKSFKTSKKD